MKVTAYLCDCGCNNVFLDKDTVGLIVKSPELFNDHKTEYDITNNIDKTVLHFSMSCHRKCVTDLLKGINRAKDEAEYTYNYKLYSTKFYERIYKNSLLRNNTGNKRNKKLLQPLGKATR